MKYRIELPRLVIAALAVTCLISPAVKAQQAGTGPVKIYLMAGQSNMEGWGHWFQNDGVTQHANLVDPTDPYPLTQTDVDGYSAPLDQIWVSHPEGNLPNGALRPGYGHDNKEIGIELSMGHELAAANTNQFFFHKSDKGGTTLAGDWRPPSAVEDRGGSVGYQYTRAITAWHQTLVDFDKKYSEYDGQGYEVAGFIWLQGWNDYGNQGFREEYRQNVVDLVHDVRRDMGIADLPVIISDSPRNPSVATHEEVAQQKELAVADLNAEMPGSAVYVDSLGVGNGSEGGFYHWNFTASNYVEMGKRNAAAAQSLMRSTAVNHEGDANIATAWNRFRDDYGKLVRYEMEEASGTTIYNTATGTMVADAVLTSDTARTNIGMGPGSARSIDANNGVIRATHNFGNHNSGFTLGAWIKLDSDLADAKTRYVIMSTEDADGSGSDTGWDFGVERREVDGQWKNCLFFDLRWHGQWFSLNDSVGDGIVLDAEQEYFVAFVRDESVAGKGDTVFHLYDPQTETLISSDGNADARQKATTFKNTRVGIGITNYDVENQATLFQGLIDDAQIWKYSLTDNDVLALARQSTLYVEPVPEPATLTLLGIGGLMLVRRRRKA